MKTLFFFFSHLKTFLTFSLFLILKVKVLNDNILSMLQQQSVTDCFSFGIAPTVKYAQPTFPGRAC